MQGKDIMALISSNADPVAVAKCWVLHPNGEVIRGGIAEVEPHYVVPTNENYSLAVIQDGKTDTMYTLYFEIDGKSVAQPVDWDEKPIDQKKIITKLAYLIRQYRSDNG